MNNKEKYFLFKTAKEYKSWEERGIKHPGWVARMRGPNAKPFNKDKVRAYATLMSLFMPGASIGANAPLLTMGPLDGRAKKQKKDLEAKKKRGEELTEQDIANLEYLSSEGGKE